MPWAAVRCHGTSPEEKDIDAKRVIGIEDALPAANPDIEIRRFIPGVDHDTFAGGSVEGGHRDDAPGLRAGVGRFAELRGRELAGLNCAGENCAGENWAGLNCAGENWAGA